MNTLQFVRRNKKLSQRGLAEKSGLKLRLIQMLESKDKAINKTAAINVYKLSQALECNMCDLIERED